MEREEDQYLLKLPYPKMFMNMRPLSYYPDITNPMIDIWFDYFLIACQENKLPVSDATMMLAHMCPDLIWALLKINGEVRSAFSWMAEEPLPLKVREFDTLILESCRLFIKVKFTNKRIRDLLSGRF